jgi:hypothetical protein
MPARKVDVANLISVLEEAGLRRHQVLSGNVVPQPV